MEKLTSILLIAEDVESGTKILEKTMLLARRFGARVDLLLGNSQDAKPFVSLCAARQFDQVVLCSVFRGAETLNEVILRRVFERLPDLVVKSPAGRREKSAGLLAREDQQLSAACPVPLMIMREQAWRDPVRFGAAVDVSTDDASLARSIVHTAGFLNLGCEGELDVIYCERELQDEVLRMARAVKLARLVREFHVNGDRLCHVDGAPEHALAHMVASGDYDVLVFGALTRQLVAAFNGDVVLLKEEPPSTARLGRAPLSFRAAL